MNFFHLKINGHTKYVHYKETTAVQCPKCDRVFYWIDYRKDRLLKKHIKTVHDLNKPFACDICGIKMAKGRGQKKKTEYFVTLCKKVGG